MSEDEAKPRRCSNPECKQPDKTEADFNRSERGSGGFRTWCRECDCRRGREWYASHREQSLMRGRNWSKENSTRRIETHRKRKYGVGIGEQRHLWAAQGGKCLVCAMLLDYNKAHLDHHHESGQVRGFLCKDCNIAVGAGKDDPRLLRRAAAYVHVFQMGHPDPHSLLIELRRIGAY